jgi:methionine-rich copper-binding protein CopC
MSIHVNNRSIALAVTLILGLSVGLAQAHARLVSAEPGPQSAVTAAAHLELHFSESIAAKLSSFKLTDSYGKAIACTPETAKDARSLAASPATGALQPGVYTVTWTAVASDDGHKTTGTYHFTVK